MNKIIKKVSLAFYVWMLNEDTIDNAQQYYHFTNEDMFNVFKETQEYKKIILSYEQI